MPKIIPVPDELSQPFWDAVNEQRLVLQNCIACDKLQYPPQAACQVCGSADGLEWKEVEGKGRVAAYIVLIWAFAHAGIAIARSEPGAIAVSSGLLAVTTLVQVIIGIATLLAHVPLSLALLHQGAAIALFAVLLWHLTLLVPAPAPDRR